MKNDEKTGQSRFTKLIARTMRDMPKAPPRAIEAVAEFGRRHVAPREVRIFTDEQRLLAILMPPLERAPGRRPICRGSAGPDSLRRRRAQLLGRRTMAPEHALIRLFQ